MLGKSRFLSAVAAALLLPGCHQQAQNAAGTAAPALLPHGAKSGKAAGPPAGGIIASPAPQPSASGTPRPTYTLTGLTTVTVNPAATPCGAEKLPNYANLLPTSTAKDEIARTLGHRNIRYVPLKPPPTLDQPRRLTAELGVDGRIKKFVCG